MEDNLCLSRTASELYWMARFLERAENTARMLDVTQTMSLMPLIDADNSELIAPLTSLGISMNPSWRAIKKRQHG